MKDAVDKVLAKVELLDRAGSCCGEYSGGMKRRLRLHRTHYSVAYQHVQKRRVLTLQHIKLCHRYSITFPSYW
jgi:ABC-type nitrate/sulfonate/bicarbonate transport system ATPase subunit